MMTALPIIFTTLKTTKIYRLALAVLRVLKQESCLRTELQICFSRLVRLALASTHTRSRYTNFEE